jgi:hypothetical protein
MQKFNILMMYSRVTSEWVKYATILGRAVTKRDRGKIKSNMKSQ